jgi:hypothetical protein
MNYIEPWTSIDDFPVSNKKAMENEIKKEIAESHPLYGKPLNVMARREDQDEVLCESNAKYYVIHLTWSGKPELPSFPRFDEYESLESFVKNKMEKDAQYY